MVYSQSLAQRVRDILAKRRGIAEKKMFGGIAFLLHGNMLVCIWHNSLIVRLGAEQSTSALQQPFVVEFDVTGKPMKGWVMVESDGLDSDQAILQWIELADAFVSTLPPKAK